MKNFERFSTPDERTDAFYSFCKSKGFCKNCELKRFAEFGRIVKCSNAWLELEAEDENPLPCPFCGMKLWIHTFSDNTVDLMCDKECGGCGYNSEICCSEHEAIAAHNRVARAVMESKESK